MTIPRLLLSLCLAVAVTTTAVAATVPTFTPPLGERWFALSLSGERTGFAMTTIASLSDDLYEIRGESSTKMVVMGFSREAAVHERYVVNRDLSLRSFAVEQIIDGKAVTVAGDVTGSVVRITEWTGKKAKNLKTKERVYPPPVVNLYPLLKGVSSGKSVKVPMLDPEGVTVKELKVRVVGGEELDGIPAIHLRNDLYPFVDNDVWVDQKGNTLKESVRDGLVVTVPEEPVVGKAFVVEGALAKRDLLLDYSRIPVTPPLRDPERLQRLVIEIRGIPATFPLLQGERQQAVRTTENVAIFTLAGAPGASAEGDYSRYLGGSSHVPADIPEIAEQGKAIVEGAKTPGERVERLVGWVAAKVKETTGDTLSPVETLKSGEGNPMARARLYTALARGAGIPTRIVAGLVAAGRGLLYHVWAESLVAGRWLPVDPSSGQVPADLSHLKLVEGDGPEGMLPLADVIGRIKAEVVQREYEAQGRTSRGNSRQ